MQPVGGAGGQTLSMNKSSTKNGPSANGSVGQQQLQEVCLKFVSFSQSGLKLVITVLLSAVHS